MKEQILADIRRLSLANSGRAPGKRAFEAETGFRESDWSGKYWARWNDAILEAGCSPNTLQDKTPDAVLFGRMIEMIRHFQRVPTVAEMRMYTRETNNGVNDRTIAKRFGGKTLFLQAVRNWAQGREGCEDAARMLDTVEAEAPIVTASRTPKVDGYVYLIKSGSHYKIGRSDEIERRVKEIRIAQPEAANLVHAIRTDDPSGIEAYWHRRFAERRANGEWFRLTAHDVAAFRRRKFQ